VSTRTVAPTTLIAPRLRLLALTRAALARLHTSPRAFALDTGLAVSPALLTDTERRAMARKLSRLQDAPEADHLWHTYWLAVVARAHQPAAIGLLGFKGPPDARGDAEIAYSIDPAYRGRGYATEAARALIDWAFADPACRAVIAPETSRANAASNRVLEKLGMRVYAATEQSRSWRLERAKR
jgi:RimJ/RimL family protein N-acetyltransferase